MVLIRRLLFAALLVSCAPVVPLRAPSLSLAGTDDAAHAIWNRAGPTVLVFYDDHCPCMTAHGERLADLARAFEPRGVRFFLVDSEVSAALPRDAAQARARRYPVPILIDRGGRVARALGAEYATYTVVLDRNGRVVFHGGIDSERNHLTAHPTEYVRDALDDVTAGRPVRRPEAEVLGCALQTW